MSSHLSVSGSFSGDIKLRCHTPDLHQVLCQWRGDIYDDCRHSFHYRQINRCHAFLHLIEIPAQQFAWFVNCSPSCLVFQKSVGQLEVVFQRQRHCPSMCLVWARVQYLSVLPPRWIATIRSNVLCRNFQNEQHQ